MLLPPTPTPTPTPIDGAALNVALRTPRLHLVPLCGHHARQLFAGLQDPAIYRWIGMAPPADIDLFEARWTRVAERALADPDVFDLGWAVQRTADGAWIGKLDAEVLAHGVATNVGYLFLRPAWGQGYASEAVRALADHLARHGVVEQRATVTQGNDASARVLERAGFALARVLPANDVIRGETVDDVEYVRREA